MTKTRPCSCCNGSGKETDPVALGRAMRQLRERKRISQTDMALKMGFSASYISELEHGRRKWHDRLIEGYKKAVGT